MMPLINVIKGKNSIAIVNIENNNLIDIFFENILIEGHDK